MPVRQPISAEGEGTQSAEGQQGRSLPPPPLQLTAGPPAAPPGTPIPPNESQPGQLPQPTQGTETPAVADGQGQGQQSGTTPSPAPVCVNGPDHALHVNARRDLQPIHFLGMSSTVTVSRRMAQALQRVDAELRAQYAALPCDANRPASLAAFAGLVSIHGQDNRHGFHEHGDAVDCNVVNQGYIATRNYGPDANGDRTRPTYGGEAPLADTSAEDRRGIMQARVAATEAMDRAVQFMRRDPNAANRAELHNRETNESTAHAYQRFATASDALRAYLQLALRPDLATISRRPVPHAERAAPDVLEARIPMRERLHPADGMLNLMGIMDDPAWRALHPNETRSYLEVYYQILRDYELVRVPLLHGRPTPSPSATRNPARGFLHMPEHFVRAMVDVGGLRWGACMFGSAESGDVHHFDMGASHNGQTWTNSDAAHSGALSHQEDDARR